MTENSSESLEEARRYVRRKRIFYTVLGVSTHGRSGTRARGAMRKRRSLASVGDVANSDRDRQKRSRQGVDMSAELITSDAQRAHAPSEVRRPHAHDLGSEVGSPADFKGTFSDDRNAIWSRWGWPGGGYSAMLTRAG